MLNALLENDLAVGFIVIFLTAIVPMAIYAIYRKRHNNQSNTYSAKQRSTYGVEPRYSDRTRYKNTTKSQSNDSSFDSIATAAVVHAALSSSDTSSDSSTSSDCSSSCDGGSM